MAGSSSIQLKEINISMAGRVNNGNYGHVEPFVALKFEMPADLENWDEAVQQCISVTHDAFIHTTATMISGYDGSRDPDDMLRELGVRVATQVTTIVDFPNIDADDGEIDDTQEVDTSKFLNY